MSGLPISVIISTYNAEAWLEKVLESYKYQDYDNFEVIIADDGSRDTTKQLIDRFKADYPVNLRHIWHEDKGYRRQELLNKCIMQTEYDYILMTDGDCIARKDFVSTHAKYAEKGYFLSGGYLKLDMPASFEDGKKHTSTHLLDEKPDLFSTDREQRKKIEEDPSFLYKQLTPELIIPKLNAFLKQHF